MASDLPVTVIGGYLGAGKTTLINGLLRQAAASGGAGPKLAVLVNDFGDVAIDADLIQGERAGVLQLAGGCVCCTIGSDLISTLVELPDKVGQPDHVLLETSGVAMPGVVAATVGLARGIRRHGVIVLADALNLTSQRQDQFIGDTIDRQLAAADLLILTKTDHGEAPDSRQLEQDLSQEFASARVLVASQGNLPIDIALEPPLQRNLAARPNITKFQPGVDAGTAYLGIVYQARDPIDMSSLRKVLTENTHGIIRAKGFVTALDGQRHLIQGVGARVDTLAMEPAGSNGAQSQLVIIGLRQRLKPELIDPTLAALGFGRHHD